MQYKTFVSAFWHRECSKRPFCLALLLGAVLVIQVGCTTPITIDTPSLVHPANPDAIAAPQTPMPDTLNVGAVARPEMNDDPHAGHMMH